MEEKKPDMERLRATVLEYIQIEEEVKLLFKKILRRGTIILFCIGFVLFTQMSIAIYFLLRPAPASQITLKYIQAEREQLLKERGYLKDARENILVMMQELSKQDSIIHSQPK